MIVVTIPEKPEKIIQVATQLGQRSALVATLKNHGCACSPSLPFRVTALGVIAHFAGDGLDDGQRGCLKGHSPDALTMERYRKLRAKCEDEARKQRLGMNTRNNNAMDIGWGARKGREP